MAEREYALGQSEQETQRLIRQASTWGDLPLRRLFEDAGIEPGMRVLDLGSGAGDVALTAAQLVGESGSVVGIDMNPTVLETARERARAAGHANVTLVVGNLDENLALSGEFDAVVGRWVLQYVADPVATLRSVLRYLRAGGIVAFQEFSGAIPSPQESAFPPSPLYARLQEWRIQAFAKRGADRHMGFKLYPTFLDAGLLEPQMRAWTGVSGGGQGVGLNLLGMLRSLRPALIEHGIAAEEELDLDAIAAQLQAEFTAERKVAIGALCFDAWSRKP